jgi:hypothetical protein
LLLFSTKACAGTSVDPLVRGELTIEFLLSPTLAAIAAKLLLQLALRSGAQPRPRVINVDGHQAYAQAITELKRNEELGRRCRCRRCPYLNQGVEQDHRFIKKRIAASLAFRSIQGALNAIDGYEAMHMIRKGRCAGWPRATYSASTSSFTPWLTLTPKSFNRFTISLLLHNYLRDPVPASKLPRQEA